MALTLRSVEDCGIESDSKEVSLSLHVPCGPLDPHLRMLHNSLRSMGYLSEVARTSAVICGANEETK
jgi:hypothetical protein